ncbi:MAG: cytochrome C oxidase subunit IV family protein [Candidatus Rokubacteria bacterium]|nr:cytochrome C oxidase subunit IV family protein [Candidatus Rokubacteria bacterium]
MNSPHAVPRPVEKTPAGAPAHPQAGPRTYLVIAAFLLVLTVMEVSVFYIAALARVLIPLLIVLAMAKFSLVAMFYMHLRFDHAWFTYLFVAPLLIATGLAVGLLWLLHVFGTTGIRAAIGG